MDVIFQVKSPEQKNYVIQYGGSNGRKSLRFNRSNGMLQTTDREEIGVLLRNENFGKDYELITSPELVDKWMNGETPDKITKDYLKDISKEGFRALADVFGLQGHKGKVNIIREMLVGKPVTQAVEVILNKFKTDDAPEDLLEKYKESGAVTRSGPWYKLGDEAITKVETEMQEWLLDNKERAEKEHKRVLKENGNDSTEN